ncbi:hypothetical protein PSA5_28140, partial [Pseudomonas syringae pv. actinidiae]
MLSSGWFRPMPGTLGASLLAMGCAAALKPATSVVS